MQFKEFVGNLCYNTIRTCNKGIIIIKQQHQNGFRKCMVFLYVIAIVIAQKLKLRSYMYNIL